MDSYTYWLERTQRAAARAYNSQEKKTVIYLNAYKDAYKSLEKETAALYARASGGGNLTLSELYKYKRYEAFMNEVAGICDELAGQEIQFTRPAFAGLYTRAYDDIGQLFGVDFEKISKQTVDAALKYPWSGTNYSENIWENRNLLVKNVRKTIIRGAVKGESISAMTHNLRDKVESSAYNARRLIRTETMHFIHQGHMDAYRRLGIDEVYVIVAADERLCSECMANDGRVFTLAEAELLLPAHPNCRCTYAPTEKAIMEALKRIA